MPQLEFLTLALLHPVHLMIVGGSQRGSAFQVECLDPARSTTIGHSLLTTIASKDAAIESHASSIQRACPVMRASPAPIVAIKSAKAASAQTMRRKALSNRVAGIVVEFSTPSIVRDANLRGGTHSADYKSSSNSPTLDFGNPEGSGWPRYGD
jgi:hypothetical protein